MTNEKQNIMDAITNILTSKLKVNPDLINEENYDNALTGKVFGLRSLDLMYLFLEIEKQFNVRIDTSKILNYEFNTINGITELILCTEAKSLS